MKRPENFYDKELAKRLTGITDDKLLEFYIEGIISRIERAIGYDLVNAKKQNLCNCRYKCRIS